MMRDVIDKDPKDWTKEERLFVLLNKYEYIQSCMDIHDQEINDKKLLKFLESKKHVAL